MIVKHSFHYIFELPYAFAQPGEPETVKLLVSLYSVTEHVNPNTYYALCSSDLFQ